jgi:hypothetical protein
VHAVPVFAQPCLRFRRTISFSGCLHHRMIELMY